MPCENLYCGALLWTQGGTGGGRFGCVAYYVGMNDSELSRIVLTDKRQEFHTHLLSTLRRKK